MLLLKFCSLALCLYFLRFLKLFQSDDTVVIVPFPSQITSCDLIKTRSGFPFSFIRADPTSILAVIAEPDGPVPSLPSLYPENSATVRLQPQTWWGWEQGRLRVEPLSSNWKNTHGKFELTFRINGYCFFIAKERTSAKKHSAAPGRKAQPIVTHAA